MPRSSSWLITGPNDGDALDLSGSGGGGDGGDGGSGRWGCEV